VLVLYLYMPILLTLTMKSMRTVMVNLVVSAKVLTGTITRSPTYLTVFVAVTNHLTLLLLLMARGESMGLPPYMVWKW